MEEKKPGTFFTVSQWRTGAMEPSIKTGIPTSDGRPDLFVKQYAVIERATHRTTIHIEKARS